MELEAARRHAREIEHLFDQVAEVICRRLDAFDGSALSRKVEVLVRDPEARLRMGQAGLRRIEREFSVERMVERTVALYDEVLR